MTAKPPYYESRYIRANHPGRPKALWLRETLLLPRATAGSADVWVMVFDPNGAGNRAVKAPHPLDHADFRADPWCARIGTTTLDDHCARGNVVNQKSTAKWDLRITYRSHQPVKLLTERRYATHLPSTKTLVRSPLARFDGHLHVDTSIAVDKWIGSVNHNWGRRHTPAYAFGQVCGFDDAPESTLEVVTARVGLGPVSLPPVTLLVLRHDGQEFAVRSVLAARHTSGSYRPFAWSFGARVDGLTLDGEITAEPGHVIGLTYTDTNGTPKYCYNSAIATCHLRLSGTGTTKLTSSHRAMFEILTDSRVEGVPMLV
ncbi:MAG: hypothetical protein JO044_15775 [Mycobacteriaceae bacterium]|nr:hypothetical protein [Mycobacteriaceae bacterium]MBV9638337.1 hypothetical protein [Mycobacteriaceae bacterium]